MTDTARNTGSRTTRALAERHDLRMYLWGVGLALLLTVVPFAMVAWSGMGRGTQLVIIGVLGLIQMVVHFRFFLHIGLRRKREDLQLILFSASLLIVMVLGTIWVMFNLADRMAIPSLP